MRAVIWLCRERIRPSPPQPLAQAMPGDVPQSAFALERCSPPPRSEALFEPVVGIGLVIESFDLLVSAVSVQLDGFNEGAVRFQVKDGDPRFLSLAATAMIEAAGSSRQKERAFELRRPSVIMQEASP